jgi:hypothetical protein
MGGDQGTGLSTRLRPRPRLRQQASSRQAPAGRALAVICPSRHTLDPHPPRRAERERPASPQSCPGQLPRTRSTRRARALLRPHAHPPARRPTTRLDRSGDRDHQTAQSPPIRPASRTRPRRRHRRPLTSLELRRRRRQRQPDQEAQASDVRSRGIRTPPQARPGLRIDPKSGVVLNESKTLREALQELAARRISQVCSH